MMQTELLTKRTVSSIGEEISHELGAQMIGSFQKANPTDVHFYIVGKKIISQILAQPGCEGIKLYNAYDENGQKTLVYVGLDANAKPMLNCSYVSNEGVLETQKGIVADRIERGGSRVPTPAPGIAGDDWNWTID
jgi:hypothetical protein